MNRQAGRRSNGDEALLCCCLKRAGWACVPPLGPPCCFRASAAAQPLDARPPLPWCASCVCVCAGEMSVGQLVELLRGLQASAVPREQEVFACMVHSLFDEYRFFQNYPEKELHTTGAQPLPCWLAGPSCCRCLDSAAGAACCSSCLGGWPGGGGGGRGPFTCWPSCWVSLALCRCLLSQFTTQCIRLL
jgi:hypothetical protein